MSEDGSTKYYDFGRFQTYKQGRVRSSKFDKNSIHNYGWETKGKKKQNPNGLIIADAELDENGNITNMDEIITSLLKSSNKYGGSYFDNALGGDGYGTVRIAIYKDLDYKVMKKYAENHGPKVFGFGKGRTYCAQFAKNVIRAGGGAVHLGMTAEQVVNEIKIRFPNDNEDNKDYSSD